jgi:AAA+ ATPase superfamily predicted ATPase
MERIHSEPSTYLPAYDFSPEGKLTLEGRSIPENASRFYDPLIEFVGQLESEYAILDINLDYFNTASSKKLLELLKELDKNLRLKRVQVNWHYEEGDESSFETAEIYQECLKRIDFRFLEYAETN